MSLLEDVFLQDEAGEAQELERIIEGDKYDERPRSSTPDSNDNSEKEDEAEEDKRQVDPSSKPKRVVKNPRFTLNPARLTGPRGILMIPEHFQDFKFKGKGHEKDDLDLVLKKLEHWAYRLYPKFQFEDCLKKIETLGKKRPVMVHLQKIRSDQLTSEEPVVVQRDSSDDEAPQIQEEDEFDKLLQQQIELARSTSAPNSIRKPPNTPIVDKSLMMPRATSSPSISEGQRERMIRNRQLAEERRLARLKQTSEHIEMQETTNKALSDGKVEVMSTSKSNEAIKMMESNNRNGDKEMNISKSNDKVDFSKLNDNDDDITSICKDKSITNVDDELNDISKCKTNRSNVIDSSDEEESIVFNETITVDIHENTKHLKNDLVENEITCQNDIEINDIVSQKINKENVEDENNIKHNKIVINNDLTKPGKNNLQDCESDINVKKQSDIMRLNLEFRDNEKEKIVNEFENMDVDFSDNF